MPLTYLNLNKQQLILLLSGPGLYAIQMLSRFFLSTLDARQLVDLLYISSVIFLGLTIVRKANNSFIRFLIGFSFFSFLLNILSVINGYLTLYETLYTSLCFIFFPAFLLLIICRSSVPTIVNDFLSYFILPLIVLNFSAALVELSLRDFAVLSALQVAGRNYELIGLIIVGLLIASRVPEIRTRYLYFGYMMTTAISFSRGAAFIFSIIFLNNIRSSLKGFLKWIGILSFGLFAIILSGISSEFINLNFGNILEFWNIRLGIFFGFGFEIASGGRMQIYSYCLEGFYKHPIFGIGMGQTQDYFISNYSNIAFSGCHNIFITPLLERGILGTILYWFLIVFASFRVFSLSKIKGRRKHFFLLLMFILYASTTGAEFFIQSSSVRNANILISIFLTIFIFTRQKKQC